MVKIHILGFPRFGARRELKFALEKYWSGKIPASKLLDDAKDLRKLHWKYQVDAGSATVAVGDFAMYDHILEWSTLIGVAPSRFEQDPRAPITLDTFFRMARGRAPTGNPTQACEMTKWFDTNYHYIVPELEENQTFRIARETLFDQVDEAKSFGYSPRPILIGPLTFLWLSKGAAFPHGVSDESKLNLLPNLLTVYDTILNRLSDRGVDWVQIDEPILVLDLPNVWQAAFSQVYAHFSTTSSIRCLLATYFGGLGNNLPLALSLPIAALHVDLVRAPSQLEEVLAKARPDLIISLGVVSGRNIWRTNLDQASSLVSTAISKLGSDRVWIAPSSSLLHVPVDLDLEQKLDAELKSWISYARQKIEEVALIAAKVQNTLSESQTVAYSQQQAAVLRRCTSPRIHDPAVAAAMEESHSISLDREPFAIRRAAQQHLLNLPRFPTTTIGSFPQTPNIRKLRSLLKNDELNYESYVSQINDEIKKVVEFQERIGLDVLVHGEPERNDMVEYFGELLNGFAFTEHGWVQSYGSRGVKPPIIFGDISRPAPMTVSWSAYAQSLTRLPMKGMLTGPVTILQWSFVRDDQPLERTCKQIALALRQEVKDLETAGIHIIQIDEPAFREGLPLRQADKPHFLQWAVDSFKLTTSGIKSETQIHTHMCYAEFNEIIEAIAAMDADVITIETSRSNMELLQAFERFQYPNDIGPGVYDIHSPNVPDSAWMVTLIETAAASIPPERLWVNPDCGLKTRGWPETEEALVKMVAAARILRKKFFDK